MSKKLTQQFACSRMMLPEHCGNLRKHAAEKKRSEEQRRPLRDEQLQGEQQQILEQAFRGQKCLEINLLKTSGHSSYHGVPRRLDENAGTIIIDTGNGNLLTIRAAEVINLILDP
jgi:hypothetical protein